VKKRNNKEKRMRKNINNSYLKKPDKKQSERTAKKHLTWDNRGILMVIKNR